MTIGVQMSGRLSSEDKKGGYDISVRYSESDQLEEVGTNYRDMMYHVTSET